MTAKPIMEISKLYPDIEWKGVREKNKGSRLLHVLCSCGKGGGIKKLKIQLEEAHCPSHNSAHMLRSSWSLRASPHFASTIAMAKRHICAER